jgi:hypothetical protein
MTGKVLSQAAEIIVTAGAQIEAMLEKTNSQMFQMMEDRGELVSEYYDYKYDRNGWIITDYIHGYELKKGGKGKRKAHGHVGVHLAFYNEQYCGNSGWEPSLFVFYAPGDEKFTLESLDDILASNFICPQDNRIWRWAELDEKDSATDSWMFSVRLLSINTEDDIQTKIVHPTRALLADPGNSAAALTSEETFFRFQWEEDTFRMSL